MKFLLIGLWMLLASFGNAQEQFQCFESSTDSQEGGKIKIFVIQSNNYRFTLVPSPEFEISSNQSLKQVTLKVPDKVAIWIQITTNYVGGLPGEEALKRNVLQQYIGAAILQSTACYSGGSQGRLVDVKRVLDSDSSLTTRHAFVPWPGGTVEFIFSTNSEDFEARRNVFGNLLNSFRVERIGK